MNYIYDYNDLRGRIRAKLGSEQKYAEKIGRSNASISDRLNNKVDFTQTDIEKSCSEEVLDIDKTEVGHYFFTRKVELNSTKNNK